MSESPSPSGHSNPSRDDLPVADKMSPTHLQKEQVPPPLPPHKSLVAIDKEIEYRVDLFHGLVRTCGEKCLDKRYKDPELYIGENSCIDRCVSKYSQVINIVGQILASHRP